MNKGKRPIGKILMILSVVFFYLPILYMIIFSFNDGKSLTSFTGFSLRWYKHMLESADMMDALSTTFSIALLATFISTVAGTIAAIGVSKSKKLIRDLMEQANNLPIMNPEIVTAIGFMLLFITFHVEKGYVTMLLAHIAFCIPYVMLSVMPKIKSLDPNLADAAMDLGATPWQALTKVVVPQITPGIVAGALIAFTMSVDDFIISYFVTDEILEKYREEGKIIELRTYQTVYGDWKYATIDDGQINLDENDYLMIGTLESYIKTKEYYGNENLIPLYIEVEDKERLMRAIVREQQQDHPGYEEVCRRFLADQKDFSEDNLKKAGITRRYQNDDKVRCKEEIVEVIRDGKL